MAPLKVNVVFALMLFENVFPLAQSMAVEGMAMAGEGSAPGSTEGPPSPGAMKPAVVIGLPAVSVAVIERTRMPTPLETRTPQPTLTPWTFATVQFVGMIDPSVTNC